MRDTKKEELRRVLFKEKHPMEKLKRIGLGALTVEGIPRGRYRLIEQKVAEKLGKFEKNGEEKEKNRNFTQRLQRAQRTQRREKRAGLKTGHYKSEKSEE